MWTIKIHGEANQLFFAMLQPLGEGYALAITHRDFNGDAAFLNVAPRSITVRPFGRSPAEGVLALDWEGLEEIEVF